MEERADLSVNAQGAGWGKSRAPYLLACEEQHPKHGEDTQVKRQQQHDTGETDAGA